MTGWPKKIAILYRINHVYFVILEPRRSGDGPTLTQSPPESRELGG
jgi:hypothetical protein